MPTAIKVILFEDTEQIRSELLEALRKNLVPDGTALPFQYDQFTESPSEQEKMYEERLEKILGNKPYDGATLVIADRDLSKSKESHFGGLSVNAVAAASKRLAIPICSYSRQPELADYEWRGRWEEGHIVLRFSDGQEELARRAALAARGFAAITAGLPGVIQEKSNNSASKILAALLGKREFAEKIGLYSVGDQNRLSEIFAKAKPNSQQIQMMSHFLGYWLWDSLLRYPGLFVNEIAAGSYLNIDTAAFREPAIRSLFDQALYEGPFADSTHPQWWRGMLDDIVSRENCADGLELVRKKVSAGIAGSKCCVDPTKQAGYYCIILRQPVSLENSKGGLSWFPRGADLTRISKPQFDEYGPWLGA
jgi:hypothetical protein